ncbi:MAG: DUF302 domain-containing protein [Armatimonadetes bacterium]|nr:DUF302 domain-containing protein [Armatimonadota bacterium]
MSFCTEYRVAGDFAEVVERVKAVLQQAGFGTLSEIDVQAIFKNKIAKDIEPYTILGVCNPVLASQVLAIDPKIGVFLPCTVVVRQEGGEIVVDSQDPRLMAKWLENPGISPFADEAAERIEGALGSL